MQWFMPRMTKLLLYNAIDSPIWIISEMAKHALKKLDFFPNEISKNRFVAFIYSLLLGWR